MEASNTENAQLSENIDASSDEQDWEWEYEEVPEDASDIAVSDSLSENQPLSKNDGNIQFMLNSDDPYNPKNNITTEESSPLSSIYGSEVYFHDNVYQENNDSSQFNLPENMSNTFSLPHSDINSDTDEPYKSQTDI